MNWFFELKSTDTIDRDVPWGHEIVLSFTPFSSHVKMSGNLASKEDAKEMMGAISELMKNVNTEPNTHEEAWVNNARNYANARELSVQAFVKEMHQSFASGKDNKVDKETKPLIENALAGKYDI